MGTIPAGCALAQPTADLEAGPVGKHRVEEHEARPRLLDELERGGGAVGRKHLEPVVRELLCQVRPQRSLVLDHQNHPPDHGRGRYPRPSGVPRCPLPQKRNNDSTAERTYVQRDLVARRGRLRATGGDAGQEARRRFANGHQGSARARGADRVGPTAGGRRRPTGTACARVAREGRAAAETDLGRGRNRLRQTGSGP